VIGCVCRLAHRVNAPALTADAAWGHEEPIRQIR
jgi:hypothetical protein